MDRLFGTDGVRGVAGRDLTCEMAFALGQAGALVLAHGQEMPTLLIGQDTRASGDMLEAALAAGILSTGARVASLGVMPTPGVAFLTRRLGADAGVVISASHNKAEDNGIKFFSNKGTKLPDEVEDRIEACMRAPGRALPEGTAVGRRFARPGARCMYLDMLHGAAPGSLSGLTLVLDCANGAASSFAADVFRREGASVYTYFDKPDGVNINDGCGSTHPEKLCALVKEHGADAGLAFDGDADRLIAVDERGREVNGDHMLALCGRALKARGELKDDMIVATVMSNIGLDIALKEQGISVARTGVGDRYVLERMLEGGYSLGGERSGHIIFLQHNPTGDGMLTALQLLFAMKAPGRPLGELVDGCMRELPQVLVSAHITPAQKARWAQDPLVASQIARAQAELAGQGRVYVRASGTEPVVRVLVECPDKAFAERQAQALVACIEAVQA